MAYFFVNIIINRCTVSHTVKCKNNTRAKLAKQDKIFIYKKKTELIIDEIKWEIKDSEHVGLFLILHKKIIKMITLKNDIILL